MGRAWKVLFLGLFGLLYDSEFVVELRGRLGNRGLACYRRSRSVGATEAQYLYHDYPFQFRDTTRGGGRRSLEGSRQVSPSLVVGYLSHNQGNE